MIEAVTVESLDDVLPLFRAYLEFYKVQDISDSRNRAYLSQFGETNPSGCQFLYREQGQVLGFSTVYFSFVSSITDKVGVMNDLYTLPEYRERGIATALINHCYDYAIKQGAVRLQWLTATDNEMAQHAYASVGATGKPWLVYVLKR